MLNWYRNIQNLIEEIDDCIKNKTDDSFALDLISSNYGYSKFYFSRKFKEISGMSLRDYIRKRKLAFAVKELRDGKKSVLEIALDFGFSSNEAFTRSFKEAFGITPSKYRENPVPLVLRTIIKPFDCYILEFGGENMKTTNEDVKVYFVTIPEHKFLHIKNYESIGYWDFWQKQSQIPGQDCETICGLLDSIKGKLDDLGGEEADSSSGQVMAFINDHKGRICSWGIPLAESYGVRLPIDYSGKVPEQMLLVDVPEGEYIVFEHGPFDYETENEAVSVKIEKAMKEFDYSSSGYELDLTEGRIFYFIHDCERFWKYVRPVKKV